MDTSEWISLGALIVSIVAVGIACWSNSIARDQRTSGQWLITSDDEKREIYIKNISPIRMSNVNIAITVDEILDSHYGATKGIDLYYKKLKTRKRCKPGETITFKFDDNDMPSTIKQGLSSVAIINIEARGRSGVRYLSECLQEVSDMAR